MEFWHPARWHAQELPPRADVPESDHRAPSSAGEQRAARMKGEHQAVVAISPHCESLALCVHIPDSDRVVLDASRQEIGQPWVPGQVKDRGRIVELRQHLSRI